MALRIEGDHYRIEWNEDECEWFGYVSLYTKDGDKYRYPTVQVRSSFELEEVMTWVINYMDDMVSHYKEQHADVAQQARAPRCQ